MRVHVVQVAYTDEEPVAARVERVAALVAEQRGADLVVLPELWPHGGFSYRSWPERAEPVDGPSMTAIAKAAAELGAVVHAGQHRRAGRRRPRGAGALEHLRRVRPGRRARGRLPQDPPLRLRQRRARAPRGRRRARRPDPRARRPAHRRRPRHLLRPALPRALPRGCSTAAPSSSSSRPRGRPPGSRPGRCWAGRGRSRTSWSWSSATPAARTPASGWAGAARSSTPPARCWRGGRRRGGARRRPRPRRRRRLARGLPRARRPPPLSAAAPVGRA